MENIRILIVDDDAIMRRAISDTLCNEGYEIDEAVSGIQALEKIRENNYNIALLDLLMPGSNGFETLTEMRKVRPGMRVIIITAFATIENAVSAMKNGAGDYIAKPFKLRELLTTVKRLIEEAKFDSGHKKLNVEDILSSLSNPIRRNIIHMLNSRKKMRLMEISRELDIEDHTKVIFHMKLLKETGIIEQDKEKGYLLTKEGDRTIELLKLLENFTQG